MLARTQSLQTPARASLASFHCTAVVSGKPIGPRVDHPCYKCGQVVEDGVPFCAHCGAPQIRVAVPETAAPADSHMAAETTPATVPRSVATTPPTSEIQWSVALPACALAGLIAALLMCLGLVVPFLAMLGGGFLAVIIYRRRDPGAIIKITAGGQLGAVSGILAFGITAIYAAVAVAFFHLGSKVRDKMFEAIQQAASRTPDPQAQAVLDYFKTPSGLAVMMLLLAVFAFLAFIVLGSIGGALAGVFLGRRNRP